MIKSKWCWFIVAVHFTPKVVSCWPSKELYQIRLSTLNNCTSIRIFSLYTIYEVNSAIFCSFCLCTTRHLRTTCISTIQYTVQYSILIQNSYRVCSVYRCRDLQPKPAFRNLTPDPPLTNTMYPYVCKLELLLVAFRLSQNSTYLLLINHNRRLIIIARSVTVSR